MESKNPKRPRKTPSHKIRLTEGNFGRVGAWVVRVNEQLNGNKITLDDIVNWVLESRPVELSLFSAIKITP